MIRAMGYTLGISSGVYGTLFLQDQQHMSLGLTALLCFVAGGLCMMDWTGESK